MTFSEDFAIYLSMPRKNVSVWFLKKKDSSAEPIPIFIDKSLSTPEQRTISWLDNIERAARR